MSTSSKNKPTTIISISGDSKIQAGRNVVIGPQENNVNYSSYTDSSMQSFVHDLDEIKQLLKESSLDQKALEKMVKEVDALNTQTKKEKPDKKLIADKAKRLFDLVVATAGAIEAIPKLMPLVQQVLHKIPALFP